MRSRRCLFLLLLSALAARPSGAYTNCGATLAYLGHVPEERRLVIAGMGAITPVGRTARETWQGVRDGRNGITRIDVFPGAERLPVSIAGQVADFRFGTPSQYGFLRRSAAMSRTHQFAVVAAVEAARDAGILRGEPGHWVVGHDPLRTAVLVGSTQGEIAGVQTAAVELEGQTETPVAVSDVQLALRGIPGMVQGHVSLALAARGPSSCPSAACASGAQAIALAGALILGGLADVVVAGGADAHLTPVDIAARHALGVLSTRNDAPERASRPWDKDRDGFVLGEGAGIVVVTSERYAREHGLPIRAYLAGAGMTSDAESLSAPSPEGQARAMALALRQAGLSPRHVGYVHAHGTSTPRGDVAELVGLQRVFDDHVTEMRVSSTKSHMGHLLGASGAVGTVVALSAMADGWAPPTRNLDEPGLAGAAGLGLDENALRRFRLVPHVAETIDVEAVAVNAFALGGQNVVLVFVRPPR
jgi:3-oxoacyl-[acyl-carrier-protein] synthase II